MLFATCFITVWIIGICIGFGALHDEYFRHEMAGCAFSPGNPFNYTVYVTLVLIWPAVVVFSACTQSCWLTSTTVRGKHET